MAHLKGILCVFGGVLIQLTLGAYFTWANLAPYVISYIRRYSHPSDIDYSSAIWVPSLYLIAQGVTMSLTGPLENKIGTRLSVLVGAALYSSSAFISAYTIRINYYLFIFSYGVLNGMGEGLAYVPPVTLAMKWFPNHRGLVTGVIISGTGAGGLILNPVQTFFINPTNAEATLSNVTNNTNRYFTDEAVLERVPSIFMVLSASFMTIQLIGICLLFPVNEEKEVTEFSEEKQPEKVKLLHMESNENENEPSAANGAYESESTARASLKAAFAIQKTNQSEPSDGQSQVSIETKFWSMEPRQALVQRPYITMWFLMLHGSVTMVLFSSLYKIYGEALVVNDDHFLALVGSAAAVGNIIGRLMWGFIADKTSIRMSSMAMFAVATISFSTIYITHAFAEEAGRPLFMIWTCLLFISFAGIFSVYPSAVIKVFGTEHASTLVGLLIIAESVSGILGILLGAFVFPAVHYFGIYTICAILSAFGFALGVSFNVKKSDGKDV